MQLLTRNGHNMYDMASMMQKAIRRGLVRYASYAAYELYGKYYTYVWKRLYVISAEDCYGIMTKEIVALKLADDEVNKGKKGYERDAIFLAKAVVLLCLAKKNRDACYVACNFMMPDEPISEKEMQELKHIDLAELQRLRLAEDRIPDWVFDVHTIKGKYKMGKTDLDMTISEEEALEPHQYSLFDMGDWKEYYDDAIKKGLIDKKQQESIEAFQELQRKKQEKHGTKHNFDRIG